MNNRFDINNLHQVVGLTEKEASQQLERDGYNEIPSASKRNFFRIAIEIIREPMLLLLLISGAIYMLLGDIQEALMLLGFVFVIIGITIYQEQKTEKTLEALRDLSSPRAQVIRDGLSKKIPGREVVTGDIVLLAEGDRVPADGIVVSSNNLSIEESLLTGESVPVHKAETAETTEMERPGGDETPFVYSGTLIVGGMGLMMVKATGLNTEFGKIGKSLQTIKIEDTLLQKETGKIVRTLAIIGGVLCVLMALIYGLSTQDWIEGFLASITLAMAILPEEFPVVLTIFLALGAWRISQSHVLTRRMTAIETLGSNTVLCVDKTGTLTLNQMSVAGIYADGEYFHIAENHNGLPEKFHPPIEFGILAGQTDPFDPMEKALQEVGHRTPDLVEHLHTSWTLVREYPLSKELLALSRVWKSSDDSEYVIASKGAPEAVMDLCHLTEEEKTGLAQTIEKIASEGLRILGVARARFIPASLPENQHEFQFEFIGLLGFADPVRPTVPGAIRECFAAGIRVVMITGDYPVTAQNIARQIGLKNAGEVLTGNQIAAMSSRDLRERIKTVNIFARVIPEQKLSLVNAFKENGEVVAMTGDGVNDAPALKSAHIGIAMGGRGTDVAREAGDLVILDDDFSSIVKAVRLGRRIFDNLRKAMAYILAVHVPIAGLSLIPVLLKWPLVLMPVHVVFLELIIDPACSIAFEAEKEEANVMNRPPRDQKEPLFSRSTVTRSVLQGLMILVMLLAVYGFMLQQGRSEQDSRAVTFVGLVLANIGLILSNRFSSSNVITSLLSENKALWWILGSAVILLGLVIYIPPIRSLFSFGPMQLTDLAICFGIGITSLIGCEVIKLLARPRVNF
jgi:P-type Ca2+ transporter type 2C